LCWHSVISPSPLKFKAQRSKAYGKSGAAKAAPNTPLLMALLYKRNHLNCGANVCMEKSFKMMA